jgi:hypothetical protein
MGEGGDKATSGENGGGIFTGGERRPKKYHAVRYGGWGEDENDGDTGKSCAGWTDRDERLGDFFEAERALGIAACRGAEHRGRYREEIRPPGFHRRRKKIQMER